MLILLAMVRNCCYSSLKNRSIKNSTTTFFLIQRSKIVGVKELQNNSLKYVLDYSFHNVLLLLKKNRSRRKMRHL